MKYYLTLILLLTFYCMSSQNLSEKEINELNNFNINTEIISLNENAIQNDLKRILELDKKRKKNKTIGIILSSASLISIITGITVDTKELKPATTTIKKVAITSGVISAGLSIPFWTSSRKRKKERDQLIEKFKK